MSDLQVNANIGLGSGKYHVTLSLVEFTEDNVTIIYSPALDLSGYGYTAEEAKESFTEALHEFFRYTTNKKTLNQVLENMGWSIKGSKKKPVFSPPKNTELISINPSYKEIINTKNHKVSQEDIEFAY